MENMEKRADNRIISDKKPSTNYDVEINKVKKRLDDLDVTESNFKQIHENIVECAELIKASTNNPVRNRKLDAIIEDNTSEYQKSRHKIAEKRRLEFEKLNKLNREKTESDNKK